MPHQPQQSLPTGFLHRPRIQLPCELLHKLDFDGDLLGEGKGLRLVGEREGVTDVAEGEEAVGLRDEGLKFVQEGRVVFYESRITYMCIRQPVFYSDRMGGIPGKNTITAFGLCLFLGGYH